MAAHKLLCSAYEKAKASLEVCAGDVKNHFLVIDLLRSQYRADRMEKTNEMLQLNVQMLTDEFQRELETWKKLSEERTEQKETVDDLRHRLCGQRQEIENERNRLIEEIAQRRGSKTGDLERGAPYEVLDSDGGPLTSTPHCSTSPSVSTRPIRARKRRVVFEGDEEKLRSVSKRSKSERKTVMQPKRKNLRHRQPTKDEPIIKKGRRDQKEKSAPIPWLFVERDDAKIDILELSGCAAMPEPKLTKEMRAGESKESVLTQQLELPSEKKDNDSQESPIATDGVYDSPEYPSRLDMLDVNTAQQKAQDLLLNTDQTPECNITVSHSDGGRLKRQRKLPAKTQTTETVGIRATHLKRAVRKKMKVIVPCGQNGASKRSTRNQSKNTTQKLTHTVAVKTNPVSIEDDDDDILECMPDNKGEPAPIEGKLRHSGRTRQTYTDTPTGISETDGKRPAATTRKPGTGLLKPRKKRSKQASKEDGDKRILVRETEPIGSQNQEEACNSETRVREAEATVIPPATEKDLERLVERREDDVMTSGISTERASEVTLQEARKDTYSKAIEEDGNQGALETATGSQPPAEEVNFSDKERGTKQSRRTTKAADLPRKPRKQRVKKTMEEVKKEDKSPESLQTGESTNIHHPDPPVTTEATVPGVSSRKATAHLRNKRKLTAESMLEGGEKNTCPLPVQSAASQSVASKVSSPSMTRPTRSRSKKQTKRTEKPPDESKTDDSTQPASAVKGKASQSSTSNKKQNRQLTGMIESDMEIDNAKASGAVSKTQGMMQKEPINLPSDLINATQSEAQSANQTKDSSRKRKLFSKKRSSTFNMEVDQTATTSKSGVSRGGKSVSRSGLFGNPALSQFMRNFQPPQLKKTIK